MKKVFKFLFSRMTITATIIILQVLLIIYGLLYLDSLFIWMPIITKTIEIALIIDLVNRDMPADLKMPWLAVIMLVPIAGIIIYLLFSRNVVRKKFIKFYEKLFIDLVDHDFCLNLNKKGYKILQVNSSVLVHNLGESEKKKVLGVTMIPTNHSALRRYYMSRNRHYIWDKYKEDFPKWVLTDKRRFITENLKIILFEDNKIEKFKYIKMGIRDYKNNIFGKFEK